MILIEARFVVIVVIGSERLERLRIPVLKQVSRV